MNKPDLSSTTPSVSAAITKGEGEGFMDEAPIPFKAMNPTRQKIRSLKSLQSDHLPRLQWRELFANVKPGELSAEDEKAFDDYFPKFLKPNGGCVSCGAQQGGDMFASFLGAAKFTWGIAHGEGFCSNRIDGQTCGYPARAYHRNVGPIKFVNLILQYHPDELADKAPSAAVEEHGKDDLYGE